MGKVQELTVTCMHACKAIVDDQARARALRDLLVFEETRDCLIVKPKVFLGSENFSKIADIVKKNGGNYVSAGKASHFRVPSR